MVEFEDRKKDHISISLSKKSQTQSTSGLEKIELIHEALPDLNFSDISTVVSCLGHRVTSPLFVSSMTLGHAGAANINEVIASVCESRGWMMGLGSQRRQLSDPEAHRECRELRHKYPKVVFFGNLGLSQLISTPITQIKELAESLGAQGFFIHTNPLQECIQPEGTPFFKGGYQALEKLCHGLGLPVVLKETGCGFSEKTLRRLRDTGLAAVDVSGKGGTHWGRVEAERTLETDIRYQAGRSFAEWGMSTVDSVTNAQKAGWQKSIWASGGVRSGLDAAKLLALGADMVGLAQPVLAAALKGEDQLDHFLSAMEYELKVAMFCMGIESVTDFKQGGLLKWK